MYTEVIIVLINTLGTCKFNLNITYALVDALFTFYLPLVAMCWSYCHVFRIARAQARRIVAARRAGGCTSSSSHWGVLVVAAREHKGTVTLAAVVGAFVVCWMPYFTYFTVMGLLERDMRGVAYSVVLWLGYTNSALNPFLYAALNRDFRAAYGRLLRCQRWGTKPGRHVDSNGTVGGSRGDREDAGGGGPMLGLKQFFSRAGSVVEGGIMLQELNGRGATPLNKGPLKKSPIHKGPIHQGKPLVVDTEGFEGTETLRWVRMFWVK